MSRVQTHYIISRKIAQGLWLYSFLRPSPWILNYCNNSKSSKTYNKWIEIVLNLSWSGFDRDRVFCHFFFPFFFLLSLLFMECYIHVLCPNLQKSQKRTYHHIQESPPFVSSTEPQVSNHYQSALSYDIHSATLIPWCIWRTARTVLFKAFLQSPTYRLKILPKYFKEADN